MGNYLKTSHGYFPDFCDQVIRGVSTFGDKFNNQTLNIVNNPLKWTDSLSGDQNPSWRDLVAHHIDATTVMSGDRSSVNARRCAVSVITSQVFPNFPGNYREFRWDGYPYYGPVPSLDPPSVDVLSRARNLAIRKFLQNVNDIRTSVEGGQLLGEWKETVEAITNPLGALRKFVMRHVVRTKKRIRRIQNSHGGRSRRRRGSPRPGNDSRAKAVATALSDTWLEFVFGWIPLVKDVNAAVVGLLDRYDQPDRAIVKGHQKIAYTQQTGESVLFRDNGVTAAQNFQLISEVDYRFRASVKTGAVNGIRSVERTLGLIPERFIPTVWELIPYSFVVDYFVNIGDIIESYAFQRQSIEWGARTVRVRCEKTFTPVVCRVEPNFNYATTRLIQMGATGGGATLGRYTVDRVPIWMDSLLPDLSIHLPFSRKAWYNLGALLTQKFCSV